jgi:twitching motility protein PilT
MIGELRDAETIDTAMKAAETGHLLVSTLHTGDAVTTIMRMMAMFPPEEQGVVRVRLAESLQAVVSQRLLPRADGKGRAVAVEVMVVTPTIRDLIVEGRIAEVNDYIADGKEQYGMQTFDQHLAELVRTGEVSYEVALAAASRPADFDLQARMNGGGGSSGGGYSPQPTGAVPALTTANGASGGGDGTAVPTGMGFDFLSQG